MKAVYDQSHRIWQLFFSFFFWPEYQTDIEHTERDVPHQVMMEVVKLFFFFHVAYAIYSLAPLRSSSPQVCPHLCPSFVPVWILGIAAAAGAWCVGLSGHCACAVWVLRYAAPWRAAADASRPPARRALLLHLTDRRGHVQALTRCIQMKGDQAQPAAPPVRSRCRTAPTFIALRKKTKKTSVWSKYYSVARFQIIFRRSCIANSAHML